MIVLFNLGVKMRVITEERLRELLPWPEQDQDVADGLNLAIEECQEVDTLTVSKLRPMSGAPRDGSSFLGGFDNDKGRLYECAFDSIGNIWIGELFYKPDRLSGWVPMPTYKPGEK
jgi:hypothetical protein